MQGEIITEGEMRQAMEHAKTLAAEIDANPGLMSTVGPVRDFLFTLAWKGEH